MTRTGIFGLACAVLAGCAREKGGPTFETDEVVSRPARLGFHPPNGRQLHERSLMTRTDPDGTEKVEAAITSRYDRQEDGWLLTQWVPQVKVTRNEEPVPPQPLTDLVTKFPLKVQLASDGAFIQFKNPEDAEAAVRTTFQNPDEVRQVLTYFTPDAIEKQARREWEDKYAALFNKDLSANTVLYTVESFTLGDGSVVRYVLERKFSGVSPSAVGDSVVLTMRCLGKADEIAKIPAAARALEASGDAAVEASVSCDGQQQVSLSPFLPVKRWIRLSARPPAANGAPVDVSLSREVTLLKLEEPQ